LAISKFIVQDPFIGLVFSLGQGPNTFSYFRSPRNDCEKLCPRLKTVEGSEYWNEKFRMYEKRSQDPD